MLTPKRIHALPLQLANQIAAGEVIERPASVIKELVENSLDAATTEIDVTIEGSGSQLIQVRDNGSGIHPDDLCLALSRHATSKISSSDQLSQISSLGFRGEALPSISSVSNLSLISRQHDSECGWQIHFETDMPEPVPHPKGTTVAVRDLFFNLPARRRFLRSARTEQQQILTTLQRLALSRFDVRFQCNLNGQQKLNLPIAQTDAQQLARIGKICGQTFVKQALVIDQQFDVINIKGWLGHTEAHRPQADQQYFFINGRVIRDRLISQVIRQAYADLIPAGRHPAYVLYMTIPLDRVDINVHPTKHEVRFRETRLIHGLIHRAISDELHGQIRPVHSVPSSASSAPRIAESTASYQEHQFSNARHESSLQIAFPVNRSNSTDGFQLIQVLHQRFAWALFQQQHYLIDLPRALSTLRQQQFAGHLQKLPLQSRPILVPLNIPCTAAQQVAVAEQQSLLDNFGFELQPQDDSLIIKKIPVALAQLDLKTMVISVIDAVSQKNMDATMLGQHLLNLLQTTDTIQPQQTEQWLQNVSPSECIHQSWCRKLDLLTLGSLFSD
ncbi:MULTISPECIES: DNA mismatch repair endonuclease MutL [unclassified Methylophaga]|jgi:DNA mismatch repair protein MutL|uniref:DNA mismatch repair endonuclease MutL n=1 Tax=unclassified Methylophaga TaxID=2629249 RepID=UPI000C8EE9F6|nr:MULTISPECIES: DNA mismatch repair endonuclease MutL [unclassified Methylophaga]MAK67945.1 DNA mismatch repair protein MutL [Methylophaga sp.]MAY16720.1 DNA mismatch repair protein MutL [Methylophaga sp.]HAO23934.1 DNA mismatch repair endonuclease MutL [Methylophaga sp.]|tara:strand:+ start:8692 stop:10368 length:1677 start_codon:yes stop_codon:yes gene_type:complete